MKLTFVRLLVSDFDACFRFYRDVMGFEVAWGQEGAGYADFKTGETTLALFDRAEMAQQAGTVHLPVSVEAQDRSMLIFEDDNLDALVEELAKRGANIINRPRDYPDWGIRAAHLRDPDGNLIEINKSMPREQWSEELLGQAETEE